MAKKNSDWDKHFELEEKLGFYATVHWRAEDMQDFIQNRFGRKLTEEQAKELLGMYAGDMQDRMVECGWDVMNSLVSEDDLADLDG